MCGRARIAGIACSEIASYDVSHKPSAYITSSNTNRNVTIDTIDKIGFTVPVSSIIKQLENLSPGMECPVLYIGDDGQIEVAAMTWGLIPTYLASATSSDHYRMFNKRLDSFASPAPYFKSVLESKRCVMLMDGFYEWRLVGSKKQPFYVHLSSGSPMVVPGIYEDSSFYDTSLSAHRHLRTFSIITTESVDSFRNMHDRQPVLLFGKEQMMDWLDRKRSNPCCSDIVRRLQLSYSSNIQRTNEELQFYAVTPKMTDPLYQAADCAVEVKLGLRRIDSIFSKADRSPISAEQSHSSTHRSNSSSSDTKRRKVDSLIPEVVSDVPRDDTSDAVSASPDPSTCAIAAAHCPDTALPVSSVGSSISKKNDLIRASALTKAAPAADKKAPSGRGESKGRARSSSSSSRGIQPSSQLIQANFKSYFVR